MTDFGKNNKGMANSGINCFMNVALQSLIACPAFFNMLTAVSESEKHYADLTENREILRKFIELSRYFDPRTQMLSNNKIYQVNTVNAQHIFHQELAELNPDNEQFDTAEFLTIMLDRLHEETKDFYISNEKESTASNQEIDWNETCGGGKVVTDKSYYNLPNSIIRDIFGGFMREEHRKAN